MTNLEFFLSLFSFINYEFIFTSMHTYSFDFLKYQNLNQTILFFDLNFDIFLEKLYGYIFQYIGILSLLLVFFFLFKNLFLYSIQYYFIQLILSFQFNYLFTLRNTLLQAFMVIFISRKPFNILTRIADNMFISTLLILNLLIFNNIFIFSLDFLYELPSNLEQIVNFEVVKLEESNKSQGDAHVFPKHVTTLVNFFIYELIILYSKHNTDFCSFLNFEQENLTTKIYIDDNWYDGLDFELYFYGLEGLYIGTYSIIKELFPELVPDNYHIVWDFYYVMNETDFDRIKYDKQTNYPITVDNEQFPVLLFFSSSVYIDNFNLFKWISFFFDSINFGFIIDNLSLLMVLIVLSISTLVHYYSIDYMSTDPWLITFLKYLSGFTTAMLILVTANNCVLMFMGWEGVGIFSYLLIGFWYTWTLALKASLKAVIVNKIGDVALLIAMGLILYFFGTVDFLKLKILLNYLIDNKIQNIELNFLSFNISLITLIAFFLLIAAVGKSAQFGLHTWLPDAMEGPTPVSALIHAATMVTAGVYLIVWTSFLFELTDTILNLVLIIGSFTALFGSAVACFQYDIKKIIAFSTCSQIGYMFLACGLSAYHVAMFHLFTHAFFKALLFLCAGSIIHSIADQQDIWKMGGLFQLLPITFAGICIGLFSLMGLPFTSGFYSKDSIIELAFCKNTFLGYYSFCCAILGAFLTAFYCYWFFFYVFFSQTKLSRNLIQNVHESGNFILVVILILSFLTIFVGFIFKQPLSSPFSYIYYYSSINIKPENFIFSQNENLLFFMILVKKLIFFIPIFGFFVSFVFFNFSNSSFFFLNITNKVNIFFKKNISFYYYIYLFWYCLQAKGLVDFIYNKLIVKPLLNFSYKICYIELDRGWFEYLFVKQPTLFLFKKSKILNQIFNNPTLMFLPAMVFILIFFFITILIIIKFNY